MDQRGGCCIARYAGGAYDKMDRIMLRFRPIAPKPVSTAGSGFGGGSAAPDNSGTSFKRGRGKRNGAVSKRINNKKKRKCSPENTDSGGWVTGGEKEIRTLTLLPEAPDVREPPKQSFPLGLSFDDGRGTVSPAAAMWRRVVVGSLVKVKCVTDAWLMDGCVGRTDEERVRSLDVDTCPGFISDGQNKVRWTNAAYRRMVSGEGAAWVVVDEGVALPVGCAAFTCRVRVVTCGKETNAKTVPCDVWKMDCGGFAWRLDTAAALSLCIGN
ncbi:hypothetical protein ACS0TY_030455 [Phlomoides rotata]